MKDKLLIVISTDNVDTIIKFPLLYGSVSMPREYWKHVHVMFWGASIVPAKNNSFVREKVLEMQKENVEFSSCILCTEEYEGIELLEEIGIKVRHTGEFLTEALKNSEWAVLNI
ncbi:DsrE family protein [Sulfurimonas marina]|uniref:DsrE family protein n=1 Tax=Sulfurimonas marina TaxID=2590551 RepID=A0A7M1AZ52_9BACT|nr:DsrE family protein [Sulfurimonas marina]QOP41828.1 DsrE family protein [Sulfurimonas marina]